MLTLAHKAALSVQRLCGPSLPDAFVARLIRGPSRCHPNLSADVQRDSGGAPAAADFLLATCSSHARSDSSDNEE